MEDYMSKEHNIIGHRYIDENPIKEDSKALILGTIYPSKDTADFKCDFFYGNDYTIWEILQLAFPDLDIFSYDEVQDGSKKTESADKIKAMLDKHHIAISDTILATKRQDGVERSKDLYDENETIYNTKLVEQIKNSKIETIYLTGTSVYQKFYKIFKDHVNIPSTAVSQSSISMNFDNRNIEVIVLPSPSESGKRGNTAYHEAKKQDEKLTYQEWCVPIYRKVFKKYLGE